MKWLWVVFALFLWVPAQAQQVIHVSNDTGIDITGCGFVVPCKTLTFACNQINASASGTYSLMLADSATAYPGGCNAQYYHVVAVTGNCDNPANVWVDPGTGTAFWGQDHAILTLSCLKIHNDSGTGIAFETRQFAIGDVSNVIFGSLAVGIVATENSKINLLSATLTGNLAGYFAMASQHSVMFLNGTVTIPSPIHIGTSFLWVGTGSEAEGHGQFTGSLASGAQFYIDASVGSGLGNLPGSAALNLIQNNGTVE